MKNEDLKYIENNLSRIKKRNVKILNRINHIESMLLGNVLLLSVSLAVLLIYIGLK